MGKKRCRCFCLYDHCFILLPTYRTHKGFLHVMDPYHFCRSDTQFFPDKLIPQVFHRGTTVRTDPFFRGNIAGDLFYGKGLIQICTNRLFSSGPCMFFYNGHRFFLLDSFLLIRTPGLFAGCSKDLPFQFIYRLVQVRNSAAELFYGSSEIHNGLFLFFIRA